MLPKVFSVFRSHGPYARFILFVSFVCLVLWTGYNVIEVIEDYAQFETIISIDRYPPNTTEMPGVTICAPTIFTPTQLANLYPNFNTSLNNFFNKQRLKFEDTEKERIERQQLFKHYESLALNRWTAIDIISNQSLGLEQLGLKSCHYHVFNLNQFDGTERRQLPPIQCFDVRPALESIYEGRKCFTFFSNVMSAKSNFLEDFWRIKNWNGSNFHHDHFQSSSPPDLGTTSQPVNVASNKNKQKQEEQIVIEDDKSTMSLIREQLLKMLGLDPKSLEHLPPTWQYQTQMIYELNPRIELKVMIDPSVWSYLADLRSIIFAIHPPNILPTRQNFAFFKLQSNAWYDFTFTKQIVQLMKSPWKTHCDQSFYPPQPVQLKQDFLSLIEKWKTNEDDENDIDKEHKSKPKPEDDNAPFKNRDECQFACVQNEIYKTKKCSNYYSMLTDRILFKYNHTQLKICDHNQQNLSQYLEALDVCQFECPPECTQVLYEDINGQVLAYDDHKCINNYDDYEEGQDLETEKTNNDNSDDELIEDIEDDNIDYDNDDFEKYVPPKSCITVLSIRLAATKFEYVRHKPAIIDEEIWGNVGGHVGIWLGLSLRWVIELGGNLLFKFLYLVLTKISSS